MTKNRLALVALVSALSMVATSCGGSSDDEGESGESGATTVAPSTSGNLTFEKLPGAGLQPFDLPSGYNPAPESTGRRTSVADCVKELARTSDSVKAQLQSLGLEGCDLMSFQSSSSARTSIAYLFRDVNGATQGLPVLRDVAVNINFESDVKIEGRRDVPVSGLGDQSLPAFTVTGSKEGKKATFTIYIWRSRNVVFFVLGLDPPGEVKENTLLDLSKKVASRAGA